MTLYLHPQMFKNLFSNNKIQVEFIDFRTGELIARSAMKQEQLPETFELHTTFTLADQEWTVMEANPLHAKEFTLTKSLKLKLQKVEKLDPKDILFTVPTISSEFPRLTDTPQFDTFQTTLYEDDWRQREFLNRSAFPLAEIEVEGIQYIWTNHNKKVGDNLNAFDSIHVRSTIGLPNLNIDFIKLSEFLATDETGSAFIENQGFVENGFSLRTENTSYAGIVLDNVIKELCIVSFNKNTIKEIEAINHLFNVIYADWYNANIIADHD